jgi:hypothetical protein
VGHPDRRHPALIAQPLQHGESLGPSHQVVHLVKVDTAAELPHGELDLGACLMIRGGPQLRGHKRTIAAAVQRPAEDALGLSVHGRGVEQVGAALQSLVDPGPRVRLGPASR